MIAEKTGYPTEMLELDMALDADLGIDSIKRVEILSALQERLPQAPVIKPEHLGTLHNLRHIAAFLAGSSNGHVEKSAPAQPQRQTTAPAAERSSTRDEQHRRAEHPASGAAGELIDPAGDPIATRRGNLAGLGRSRVVAVAGTASAEDGLSAALCVNRGPA